MPSGASHDVVKHSVRHILRVGIGQRMVSVTSYSSLRTSNYWGNRNRLTAVVAESSSRWYRPSTVDAETASALRCCQAVSLGWCHTSTLPLGDGCYSSTHKSPLLQAKGCYSSTRLSCPSCGKLTASFLTDELGVRMRARRSMVKTMGQRESFSQRRL